MIPEIFQLRTDILYHYIKQMRNGIGEPQFIIFLKKLNDKNYSNEEILECMEIEYDRRLTVAMPKILHDIMNVG